MIINTNMASINAQKNLASSTVAMQKSLEKLSSGYRINRAADDAAGLAISEKMRAQIRGLNQAKRNAQDGISLLQTAEGALSQTQAILQRMRELAVQASNGTLQPEDRNAITTEMNQLVDEIDRIANATQFNGKTLLNGSFGSKLDTSSTLAVGLDNVISISVSGARAGTTFTLTHSANNTLTLSDGTTNQSIDVGASGSDYSGTLNFDKLGVSITLSHADLDTAGTWSGDGKTIVTTAAAEVDLQIGANQGASQKLGISFNDMTKTGLGINAISLADTASSQAAITTIETAIQTVSNERAQIGAWQNRLESSINNLSSASENLTAAESRIRDADMAQEMSTFTKNQILNQAGVAMLAQANQVPQAILKLLG